MDRLTRAEPTARQAALQAGAPAMPESDPAIVRRVLAGDREAFRLLVERHEGHVYRAVLRVAGDADEAEDLAQETFLKAFRHLGRYDERWAFSTWLQTIATRTALNARRARSQAVAASIEAMEEEGRPLADPRATDPAAAAQRGEWLERLRAEVAVLGQRMRVAFGLRYEEGLSVAEIAAITHSSETAVKVALHRARKALRERLRGFAGPA